MATSIVLTPCTIGSIKGICPSVSMGGTACIGCLVERKEEGKTIS